MSIEPADGESQVALSAAARAWMAGHDSDSSFANDLERVGAADRPPENPWESMAEVNMSKPQGAELSVACSIAPMLSVRNGARAVEFYKSAFGAIEAFRIDSPDGAVVCRLSVEGAEFWVADESPEHANFSPESLGGGTVRMILTVPDPDAMFARAIAAGAQEVIAVKEDYGWRLGRVVDPFGHHWEIGRPLQS